MSKEFTKRDIYRSPKKSFIFSLPPLDEIKDISLFVLDANILLLPYTTDVKSLDAIRNVYTKLVSNNKLFIPSQSVREYLDNRSNKLANINESLSKKSNQSFNYVGKHPLLESLGDISRNHRARRNIKASHQRVSEQNKKNDAGSSSLGVE